MKNEESKKTVGIKNTVKTLVDMRGLGDKFSEEELSKAGVKLSTYKINDNFKFCLRPEPWLYRQVKKQVSGINFINPFLNDNPKSKHYSKARVDTWRDDKAKTDNDKLFNLIRSGREVDFKKFCYKIEENEDQVMSLRDEKGWNAFHHALYNNRINFIEKIILKAKARKPGRIERLKKQNRTLIELDDLTYADQTPLMVYGRYINVDTFQFLYNPKYGLTHLDDLGQNIIF